MTFVERAQILLDLLRQTPHEPAMSKLDWDAEASLLQYPPLEAPGADEPLLLLRGSLRACLERVASLQDAERANLEIETADGVTLLNAADIAQILSSAPLAHPATASLRYASSSTAAITGDGRA